MDRRALVAILIAVLTAWPPPAAAQSASADQPATVVVDGRMVAFDQPPALVGGRLLIPLRGVFERLGAQVEWQASPGIVVARRGATVIILQPGNRTARVDDRAVSLDVPAVVVNGRTLVPLRFVGEALGARVEWDAGSRVVYVTSPAQAGGPPAPPPAAPPATPPPAPPVVVPVPVPVPVPAPAPAPAPVSIDGTIVRIEPYTSPARVHVLSHGAVSIVPVAPDATVFITEVSSGRGGAASLEQVRRGDFARVLIDAQGRAISIRASHRQIVGRLDRLTSRRVSLSDGQTLMLTGDVLIIVDGRQTGRSSVQPGMVVTLRVNPQTNEVWEIHARTAGAPAPPVVPPPVVPPPVVPPPVVPAPIPPRIETVGLSSAGPLGVGATLTVTMRGTPGADAFLDIGQQATSLRMQEGPAGQYAVGYTVRPGEAARAVVTVRMRTRGVEVSRAVGTIVIDGLPPSFTSARPEPNSTVASAQPTIIAGFADRGPAGIRTDSVRLWLDGREERRAAVTASSVSYVPSSRLTTGRHRVHVVIADLAGNEASTEWTFVVSPPAPTVVAPTSVVSPSIIRPTPTPNVTPSTVPPVVSPSARTSATPSVAPPVILSPKPGDAIPQSMIVRGTGIPGTRVQVTVDYESTARAAMRGTLGPITANVGRDGAWEIRVRLPDGLGEARLVINALTVAGNLRSEPARVTIPIVIPQRDPEK
jgi:hypothetical protein